MDSTQRHGRRLLAVGALALAVVASIAPGASVARDGDVIKSGSCSGASDWKLKLSPENGRIEVEFQVDQNRVGRTWNVRLKKNGNVFWKGQKVTTAPSGSFTVRKLTRDSAGPDYIVGRARNPQTDEVCRGKATFTS